MPWMMNERHDLCYALCYDIVFAWNGVSSKTTFLFVEVTMAMVLFGFEVWLINGCNKGALLFFFPGCFSIIFSRYHTLPLVILFGFLSNGITFLFGRMTLGICIDDGNTTICLTRGFFFCKGESLSRIILLLVFTWRPWSHPHLLVNRSSEEFHCGRCCSAVS